MSIHPFIRTEQRRFTAEFGERPDVSAPIEVRAEWLDLRRGWLACLQQMAVQVDEVEDVELERSGF